MANKKHKPLPPISEADIARFWTYVDIRGPEECWPWLGGPHWDKETYGVFHFNGRQAAASRVAFLAYNKRDAWPLMVLHSCDWKPCCNPSHLSAGTHKQNAIEVWKRLRPTVKPEGVIRDESKKILNPHYFKRRGSSHRSAKLTEENVISIRSRYPAGDESMMDLAKEFGVTQHTIYAILRRIIWKHIP